MRFLPVMFLAPLLFMGCKSDQPISFTPVPSRADIAVTDQHPTISTTNIYYMKDIGPGCAIFTSQSDAESEAAFFGTKAEGTRVVVVDGHFPPPTQMPISQTTSVSPAFSPLDSSKRDLSLIDDTGTR